MLQSSKLDQNYNWHTKRIILTVVHYRDAAVNDARKIVEMSILGIFIVANL